jgi:AcrR family transcriptional regulator
MPRRSVDHLERKHQIITTALKIANEEDWEEVTMRRIGAEMNLSLPNLYRAFTCKEEIMQEVARRGFQILLENSRHINESSLHSLLSKYFHLYYRFGRDNKAMYQAMYGLNGVKSFQEQRLPESLAVSKFFEQALRPFCPDLHRDATTRMLIDIAWSQLHGFICLSELKYITNVESRIKQMVEFFYQNILSLSVQDT